jgi:hypothetical protein
MADATYGTARGLLSCPRYPPWVVSGLVLEIVPGFTAGSDRAACPFYGNLLSGYDPKTEGSHYVWRRSHN